MSSSTERIGNRIERADHAFTIKETRDQRDSVDLRYGVLHGPAKPKRYVVLLNGRTEWLEKYGYLPGDLRLPADCGFLTWDHRGQGASGGARSFVDHYDTYAEDAATIVKEVVGDLPYAMIAHSMGGLIGLYATLGGYLKPRSLVLSSPLLGMPREPVPVPLARRLSKALTGLKLGTISSGNGSYTGIPFEQNKLTHHAELYRRMQNNPYRVPGATFAWITATFDAIATCFSPEALAKLETPTLLLGGTLESVVDSAGFRAWVQAASQHAKAEVQLRMIPGAKHELFSEIPDYYRPSLGAVREWFKPLLS